MSPTLTELGNELDFDAGYARLRDLPDDQGDETRVYSSTGEHALKGVIAELSDTPAESGRRLTANNELHKQVYSVLEDDGWADRLHERKFRLLVPPSPRRAATSGPFSGRTAELATLEPVPLTGPDDDGIVVESVAADSFTGNQGRLSLGGLEWSDWAHLEVAV